MTMSITEYTGIEISEFVVKARSKVGDIALEITEKYDVEGLSSPDQVKRFNQIVDLIDFTNFIESNYTYEQYNISDVSRHIDNYDYKASINELPLIFKNPFSRVDRPKTVVINKDFLEVPHLGHGYLRRDKLGNLYWEYINTNYGKISYIKHSVYERLNPLLDNGVIYVVEDTEGNINTKYGTGDRYNETPFASTVDLSGKVDKPIGVAPTKVLHGDGTWKEIPVDEALDTEGNKLIERYTLDKLKVDGLNSLLEKDGFPKILDFTVDTSSDFILGEPAPDRIDIDFYAIINEFNIKKQAIIRTDSSKYTQSETFDFSETNSVSLLRVDPSPILSITPSLFSLEIKDKWDNPYIYSESINVIFPIYSLSLDDKSDIIQPEEVFNLGLVKVIPDSNNKYTIVINGGFPVIIIPSLITIPIDIRSELNPYSPHSGLFTEGDYGTMPTYSNVTSPSGISFNIYIGLRKYTETQKYYLNG